MCRVEVTKQKRSRIPKLYCASHAVHDNKRKRHISYRLMRHRGCGIRSACFPDRYVRLSSGLRTRTCNKHLNRMSCTSNLSLNSARTNLSIVVPSPWTSSQFDRRVRRRMRRGVSPGPFFEENKRGVYCSKTKKISQLMLPNLSIWVSPHSFRL